MEEIVASDRGLGRLLALLPALVVGVCVRGLTLGTAPLALRVAAAAMIAAACWTASRLLTARLSVDGDGIHVRGVLSDADRTWTGVQSADVVPAARPSRALVWGVMQPHTLELRTPGARLRPVVTLGASDDHDLRLVMSAIRAYLSSSGVPAQRRSPESVTTA
jgi:hypothetical protein